jgi:hypothetical protein
MSSGFPDPVGVLAHSEGTAKPTARAFFLGGTVSPRIGHFNGSGPRGLRLLLSYHVVSGVNWTRQGDPSRLPTNLENKLLKLRIFQ